MLLFIRLWLPGSRFLFEHWNLNLEAFLSERTFPLCVERSDFPFSYFNIFHYFLGSVLSASMKPGKCWVFYLHENLRQSWGLYDIVLKLVSVAQHPSSPGNRGEKTKKQTKKKSCFFRNSPSLGVNDGCSVCRAQGSWVERCFKPATKTVIHKDLNKIPVVLNVWMLSDVWANALNTQEF